MRTLRTRSAGRLRLVATAVVALTVAAIAALAGSASPALASCGTTPARWPIQPRLVVHLGELKPSGWNVKDNWNEFTTELQLMAQVNDAVNRFNAIGGTSAQVTSVTSTYDPFTMQGSYNDSRPTIHIGFRPKNLIVDSKGNTQGAITSPMYLSSNCSPTVTTEYPDIDTKAWSFSSPFALAKDGASYYDAGLTAPTADGGGEWFRATFLHELEHAFGLQHTLTDYAIMNHRGSNDPYGGFPWANRPDADSMQPLPWDVKQIRDLYPASGSRWDVAALNTWFHVVKSSGDDAAHQVKLCTPSLGTQFTDNETTSGPCGTGGTIGGSTRVSEGDTLRTRFAIANYSTGSVHVESHLWLSTDEQLSDGDIPANSLDVRDIPAATSQLAEVGFKLSSMPAGTYHPIVAVSAWHLNSDGTKDSSKSAFDWIPLRGTVFHCDGFCTATQSSGGPVDPTP